MSVKFSGGFSRSKGIFSSIVKNLKQVNLKAVKRVTVTFDPFQENVKSTRDFLFYLSSPNVLRSNPNCAIKTEIVCDRSPSTVVFSLIPSVQEQSKLKEIKINSDNLNSLELLQVCNRYITTLAPKEEPVNTIKTKSEKKAGARRK